MGTNDLWGGWGRFTLYWDSHHVEMYLIIQKLEQGSVGFFLARRKVYQVVDYKLSIDYAKILIVIIIINNA